MHSLLHNFKLYHHVWKSEHGPNSMRSLLITGQLRGICVQGSPAQGSQLALCDSLGDGQCP